MQKKKKSFNYHLLDFYLNFHFKASSDHLSFDYQVHKALSDLSELVSSPVVTLSLASHLIVWFLNNIEISSAKP